MKGSHCHKKGCIGKGRKVCHNPTCCSPVLSTNEPTMTCGKCHFVNYCSVACQTQHWPMHRADCVDFETLTLFEMAAFNQRHCSLIDILGCHLHPTHTMTDLQISLYRQVCEQIQLLPKGDKHYSLSCSCNPRRKGIHSPDISLQFDVEQYGGVLVYAICGKEGCRLLERYKPLLLIQPTMTHDRLIFASIPHKKMLMTHNTKFCGTFTLLNNGATALDNVPPGCELYALSNPRDTPDTCNCGYFHVSVMPIMRRINDINDIWYLSEDGADWIELGESEESE